jgi:hypothetical protein
MATSRPLFEAIRHGYIDRVKSLLPHHHHHTTDDTRSRNDDSKTHKGANGASSSSSGSIVDDINTLDITGDTAIGIAIDHGYDHILQLLINAHANANLPNAAGHLPLIRACKRYTCHHLSSPYFMHYYSLTCMSLIL